MSAEEPAERLSEIPTSWSNILRAHNRNGTPEELRAAQEELLGRYAGTIRQYLSGALRGWANHREMVDEAFQNFSLRFVAGAFAGARQERGRFRDYLRTALRNLVADQQRLAQAQPEPLGDRDPADSDGDDEAAFLVVWREGLLARAMQRLEAAETANGRLLFPVLQFVMSQPGVRSAQVAEEFSRRLERPVDEAWARKRLMFARQELAELIVEDIESGLEAPTVAAVEEELAAVGLLERCRSALQRRCCDGPSH